MWLRHPLKKVALSGTSSGAAAAAASSRSTAADQSSQQLSTSSAKSPWLRQMHCTGSRGGGGGGQEPELAGNTVVTTTAPQVPIYHRAPLFFEKIAVTDMDGDFTYEDVYRRSCKLANELRQRLDYETGNRICVVCPKGVGFVVAKWAVWMSGNVFVPLVAEHSPEAVDFFVRNCGARAVIATDASADKIRLAADAAKNKLAPEVFVLGAEFTKPRPNTMNIHDDQMMLEAFPMTSSMDSAAMLLYTAGSQRNGNSEEPATVRSLMYNHSNLNGQARSVSGSWLLNEKTSLMHSLPLNTPHGIASALMAPLSVGGRVIMISNFDSVKAWSVILGLGYGENRDKYPRTSADVISATPPQYKLLLQRYEELFTDSKKKQFVRHACRKRVRLMISNMAPVPKGVLEPWRKATGHDILECYSTPEVKNIS